MKGGSEGGKSCIFDLPKVSLPKYEEVNCRINFMNYDMNMYIMYILGKLKIN